jgi:hypothetical protein
VARVIRRRGGGGDGYPGDGGAEPAGPACIDTARPDDPPRSGTAEPAGTAAPAADVDPGRQGDEPGRPVTDLAEQRRALIDLVIYAYDRTTSTGVRARLADGLSRVGVQVVQPDGEPFDATRHEAGGVEPTDDDALHDRIAETERAGFRDRDRVIRDPTVVVYQRR